MSSTKVWFHDVVVEGSGSFPLDMLRYDRCIPSYEIEIHKLKDAPPAYRDKTQVCLTHISFAKQSQISVERWKSFGWNVISVKEIP